MSKLIYRIAQIESSGVGNAYTTKKDDSFAASSLYSQFYETVFASWT